MAHEVTQEEIQMIEEKVARARVAQDVIAQYSQERVDKLIQAVGAAVTNMKVWAPICDEAVDETALGDKVTKRNKRNKIKLILRDCLRAKSVGIIEEIPEKGKFAFYDTFWMEEITDARRPDHLRDQGP